jgi:hypothetical protein
MTQGPWHLPESRREHPGCLLSYILMLPSQIGTGGCAEDWPGLPALGGIFPLGLRGGSARVVRHADEAAFSWRYILSPAVSRLTCWPV